MTNEYVKQVLEEFAVSDINTATVLKGRWGTGKTFFWEKVVAAKKNSFHNASYSYVSLFGIDSLADLKRTIVENKVDKYQADEAPSILTASANLNGLTSTLSSAWALVKDVPMLKGLGSTAEALQYLSITNCLICIDDYERRGSSLSAKDVLGLITTLVEKKKCRVILLLNTDALEDNDSYYKYHEKVFQKQISFKPSPYDSAKIAFPTNEVGLNILSEYCQKLEITNIRILKNSAQLYRELIPALQGAADQVVSETAHTLALAMASIYDVNYAVPIDFIYEYSEYQSPSLALKEEPPEARNIRITNEKYANMLVQYGYSSTTEYDKLIFNYVQDGFLNSDSFEKLTKELEYLVKYQKDIAMMTDAWSKVKESFGDNISEILADFDLALPGCIDKIRPYDMCEILLFFRATDTGLEKKWSDNYFNFLYDSKPFDYVNEWPEDLIFSEKLKGYLASLVKPLEIRDIIDIRQDFLTPQRCKLLSEKTSSEFYNYLIGLEGAELNIVIKQLMEQSRFTSSAIDEKENIAMTFIKAYSGLLEIKKSSPLNAYRVSHYLSKYEKSYELHREVYQSVLASKS